MPVKIFFCYAHEDEVLRNELVKHLSLLKRQHLITNWYDRNISAGTKWAKEIDRHLKTADIILLLVSPDFMASDYCYDIEMKRAVERHERGEACVIPIILRQVDWQDAPFGQLQALPPNAKPVKSWHDQDEAFLDIARGIRQAVEELNVVSSTASTLVSKKTTSRDAEKIPHQRVSHNPYRGLSAFQEQDKPFFCGRGGYTEQLIEGVRRMPLLAVVGSSGSGKSSLVFAGLLPRLREEGWRIASFRPRDRPFRALAAALIPLLETQMSETDLLMQINKMVEPLWRGELPLYDIAERILQKQNATHLLLFADQFEELYTHCREVAERQRFLDSLLLATQMASQQQTLNFTLTITLRADFFGQVLSYRPFADALQHSDLKLGPMNRQELLDAIKTPAERINVAVEDGLPERILDAIGQEPGNLPLLEFTLTQLWNKQRGGILTHAVYKEIGGVEQSLATYAERVYAELSDEEQQRARKIFVQLVHPGEGTEDTRRVATRAQVREENWNLVIRLSDARLLVTGRDEAAGEEIVEVAHEVLIREWRRLHEWMTEDREFRIWQERLRTRMREWERTSQSPYDLLQGFTLDEAEAWRAKRSTELNPAEQDFIHASHKQQQQEKQRKEMEALKDEFFSIVTHELRAPVTLIKGYTETLIVQTAKGKGPKLADWQSEALQEIDQATSHLVELMEDQLDVTRLQTRRLVLCLEPIDLVALAQRVIKRLQRTTELHTLSLHAALPHLVVDADPNRLEQVLTNLMANAVKYSPQGGPIKVTIEQGVTNEALLSVRDHGIGIPVQQQGLIFSRFTQADNARKYGISGTGLGLYICRELVELHGGRIWFESVEDQGSTFFIALPITRDILPP